MQSDRILACLLRIKLLPNFHKCPLKQMQHRTVTPRHVNTGISRMSLVGQKCEKLNSAAIEVQITASRLLSRGDEQRKLTSPLILPSQGAGCRWEQKAAFPFPPQRLSLPLAGRGIPPHVPLLFHTPRHWTSKEILGETLILEILVPVRFCCAR